MSRYDDEDAAVDACANARAAFRKTKTSPEKFDALVKELHQLIVIQGQESLTIRLKKLYADDVVEEVRRLLVGQGFSSHRIFNDGYNQFETWTLKPVFTAVPQTPKPSQKATKTNTETDERLIEL